jgi:hypothetical protein
MSLTGPPYERAEAVARLVRDGVRRIRVLPGVEVTGFTCCVPLEGGFGLPFQITGPPDGTTSKGDAGWNMVSAGYFETFKIPVLRGRTFREQDDGGPCCDLPLSYQERHLPRGSRWRNLVVM